ncbi:hypothetical protein K0A97_03365, partial [Patescibacteria group bacterium]|nr:hypothetical protein [Patescibacteria group bacterium]
MNQRINLSDKKRNNNLTLVTIFAFILVSFFIFFSFQEDNFNKITGLVFSNSPSGSLDQRNLNQTRTFIIDGLEAKPIIAEVNQSHIKFYNEDYLNLTIRHIDFFVPTELQYHMSYLTPCNPSLMVCQDALAPDPIYGQWDLFHILNDWTNIEGDRFYIETDYIFNQEIYDPNGTIPEGFNWKRINQEIRINYTLENTGLNEFLESGIQVDENSSINIT